ncbi:response regulator transcription factor [Sulfitobacter sp. AS92]|uniref:response regulator transcription factor n=1 Tax=Sulfitobacter sp. AS92 TaxID=3135783 RepID=UPI00317AC657
MHKYEHFSSDKVSCFFVGNSHDFSDTLLKLAQTSFENIAFCRLPSVESLLDLTVCRPDRVRSIILNQSMAVGLKTTLPVLLEQFSNATVALSYRQPKLVRNILNDMRTTQPPLNLAFLPMNRDVDRWLTLLQLLICGENYIPSELYTPADAQIPEPIEICAKPKSLLDPAVQASLSLHDPALKVAKDELTNREMQVLTCVAEGKQNKVIANSLGLSEHTVKLHIHHVISKLGVNNRTEAAVWFLEKSRTEIRSV